MVFADALASHLLPQGGAAWIPQGTQAEVMTPGQYEQHALAGALHLALVAPGKLLDCLGPRKNHGLFRDLLTVLDTTSPAPRVTRISVVVDHSCIDKAQAVEQRLASHPRFPLLRLPTDCPRANPMERAFGDVHDNRPWRYRLSQVYDAPESTAAVEHLAVETQARSPRECTNLMWADLVRLLPTLSAFGYIHLGNWHEFRSKAASRLDTDASRAGL